MRKPARMAAVVAGLSVLVLATVIAIALRGGDPDTILAEPRGPNGELTRSQVERLLASAVRDRTNSHKRYLMDQSWIGRAVGTRVSAAIYPERRAIARIGRQGNSASRWLADIALDPREGAMITQEAVRCFMYLPSRGFLQAFSEQALNGTPTWTVAQAATYCLPGAFGSPGPISTSNPAQWFKEQFESKTVDELLLERLDAVVANVSDPRDRDVLFWLNRYYGVDFDDWLAAASPEQFAFRNKALEEGYDPAQSIFLYFTSGKNVNWAFDEALVKKLYPKESDQAAMRGFFQCYTIGGPLRADHPPDEGWHQKLTTWYTAHRSRLVYDAAKHRFVVGKSEMPKVRVDSTSN
jgi:hypothetical protein